MRSCNVTGCANEYKARGFCDMHYQRLRKHGNPLRVDPPATLPVLVGAANAKWKGDAAKYSAVHNRLRRRRGAAADHACPICQAPGAEWSYDRSDPDQLVDEQTGFPYSADISRYWPLCRPCHYRIDRRSLARAITRAAEQVVVIASPRGLPA